MFIDAPCNTVPTDGFETFNGCLRVKSWRPRKVGGMKVGIRSVGVLAIFLVSMAAPSFGQAAGQDVYKAKCQMCHGAAGMADSGAGKAMKVKPVTDPDVKKLTEEQMIDAVKNGSGKMQPFKDKITDAQIKDSVGYFRSFIK